MGSSVRRERWAAIAPNPHYSTNTTLCVIAYSVVLVLWCGGCQWHLAAHGLGMEAAHASVLTPYPASRGTLAPSRSLRRPATTSPVVYCACVLLC